MNGYNAVLLISILIGATVFSNIYELANWLFFCRN